VDAGLCEVHCLAGGGIGDLSPAGKAPVRNKRADAVRNQQTLLAAAAEVFVTSGVDAPIRQIAAKAGVGMGTIYRHFPTRADLVTTVYRHQIQTCAEAGPSLLASAESPVDALRQWIDLFVDFLVTKHGLAGALQSDSSRFARCTPTFSTAWNPSAHNCWAPRLTLVTSGPARSPTS
jgi:AcrR family transcriptional regulator